MALRTDEMKMLRDTVRQFVDREYPPSKAREIDEDDRFPRHLVAHLAKLELMGLTIPEEFGGSGRDIPAAVMVCEELARRSLALAWVYVMGAFFGGENIRHLGTDQQTIGEPRVFGEQRAVHVHAVCVAVHGALRAVFPVVAAAQENLSRRGSNCSRQRSSR